MEEDRSEEESRESDEMSCSPKAGQELWQTKILIVSNKKTFFSS